MLLAGEFCEEFFINCQNIISGLKDGGLEFRYPWGTHITTCRFLENGNKEQIQDIQEVIKEIQSLMAKRGDLLKSKIFQMDVGYYKNDGRSFDLQVYERINIE